MSKYNFQLETVLILIYTAVLLAFSAVNSSIWLDEAFSLASARASWSDMFLFYHYDVHPPLYYILLKSTFILFGESVFAAKILSIFPAVLTLVATSIFLKKEFSRRSSIIFLLCAIASTSILLNGVEIRSYSWSLLFVTLAYISVWYIAKTGKTFWYAAFVLCAEGAAFSHYYSAIAAAYIYMLLLTYVCIYDRQKLTKVILFGLGALLLFLPWAISVLKLFNAVVDNYWQKSWNTVELFKYVYNTFAVGRAPAMMSRILTVCNIGIFSLLLVCFYKRKDCSKRDFLIYGSLGCIVFVALVGVALTLLIRPLFLGKYLFSATGLVFVFFAIAFHYIKNNTLRKGICALIVLFCVYNVTVCINKEVREEVGYKEFRSVFTPAATDIFVFPDNSYYLSTVISYLYPKTTIIGAEHKSGPYPNEVVWNLFDVTQKTYDKLANEHCEGRNAWVFVFIGENDPENIVNPRFPVPDGELIYKGLFGYDFYRFKLYYTEQPQKLLQWLPAD
jgi:hypothetical protein